MDAVRGASFNSDQAVHASTARGGIKAKQQRNAPSAYVLSELEIYELFACRNSKYKNRQKKK